ncbi:protein of unknown function [Cupriavidus taiwanensis]|uniref:Uncharacterized protein n=1 Tax=Cupriavidus taiwanensis TaxID=164546 RepID=A0A375IF39_9BURK|nr:protein of unknown function [Cupriavidus taiwanensis]
MRRIPGRGNRRAGNAASAYVIQCRSSPGVSEHPCNRAFPPARSCERTAAAGAAIRDDTELANHRVHLPACSAKHTASPAVSDQVFAQAIRARRRHR